VLEEPVVKSLQQIQYESKKKIRLEQRKFSKDCVEAIVKEKLILPDQLPPSPESSGSAIGIGFEGDNDRN